MTLSPTVGASEATKSTPDAPGPPGLVRSEPMRSPVAGWRLTASSISPAAGSCQERGARAVVHSQPAPHSSHARVCP
ncbi:Uncharacterised protein [Mycobacteroides abscessus]|nr:Uncharacterised protein [Mycobacteroides abscessus]